MRRPHPSAHQTMTQCQQIYSLLDFHETWYMSSIQKVDMEA
jgi:hypothetical protein